MAWLQLTLETESEQADFVSDCLNEVGALAVTLQDAKDTPLFEPKPDTTPLWPMTIITGLFDANCDLGSLKKELKSTLGNDALFEKLKIEPLEDQNWVQASLDQFKPLRFGTNLWVIPTWSERPPLENSVSVILNPGLAFGTGTHPTTRLCLEWLEENPPKDLNVVDYGAGSGILSLAAAKLGAKTVFAVDYDPQSLQSTNANAKQNDLPKNLIRTFLPEELPLTQTGETKKADLILANILADPLIELAETFAHILKPKGIIVLSGILEHQIAPLIKVYEPWFENFEIENLEGWALIKATKTKC